MSPKRSSRPRSSGSSRNRPGRPAQLSAPSTPAPGKAADRKPAADRTPAGTSPEEPAEQAPGWLTRTVSAVPERVRELALVISGAVVSIWAALLLSIAGAYFTPLRVGTIQVPVSILLGIGGNALVMWFAYRVTRNKILTLLPGGIWVALTFVASGTTSERDVVLLGNWVAIVYLLSGCVTVTVFAYFLLVPQPPTERRTFRQWWRSRFGPGGAA